MKVRKLFHLVGLQRGSETIRGEGVEKKDSFVGEARTIVLILSVIDEVIIDDFECNFECNRSYQQFLRIFQIFVSSNFVSFV